MRYDPKQSYEDWASRVRLFEQGAAMQRIALGEDLDKVMQKMAKNINQPVAYPIFTFRWLAIHGLAIRSFDYSNLMLVEANPFCMK